MGVYAYDNGQRYPVVDPLAYLGGLPGQQVESIYAYHDGGQRTMVWARTPADMTATAQNWDEVLVSWTPPGTGADSYRLHSGGTEIYSGADLSYTHSGLDPTTSYDYRVEAVRSGSVVGEATASETTPAYPSVTLNASATAYNSVSLSWTALDGSADQYVLNRSSTNIYQGGPYDPNTVSKTSHVDGSRSASTTYNYTLQHRRAGVVLASDTDSATTPARPTQQLVWTSTPAPIPKGSYNGNGTMRNSTGPFYSGNYTPGTRGRQKSAFWMPVPSGVRNCISVDKVEVSVSNAHSYYNNGLTQYLALTHTASNLFGTWPGSTGAFGGRWTDKGGWYGGSEWINITNDVDPTYGKTVAENFRTNNAQGICLIAPDDNIGYYGYWNNNIRLRITYTVYS